jgi:hypothetical protein
VRAAIHVLGRTALIPDREKQSLNLDAVNLAGADFAGLPGFRGTRFQGAHLHVANFEGADLAGARFSGARMSDVEAYGPSFYSDAVFLRKNWDDYEKYCMQFSLIVQTFVWPGRALQDGVPRPTNVRAATMY